jgi:hypothetical protein
MVDMSYHNSGTVNQPLSQSLREELFHRAILPSLPHVVIILSIQLSRYSDKPWDGRPEDSSKQGQDFPPSHNLQTGSGAHSASYPMGTGGISPGVKRPGCQADCSPLCSAEVKKGGAIHPLPRKSS